MKNEHTPGPWKVADAGYRVFDGFGTLAPIYGANGVGLIAYVLKKDEDNAPIIAAAPEMFAELATLRAENARLNNAFFEMCGSDLAAKVDNDRLSAQIEILQGAYDTAKDHAKALSAENAQLREALNGIIEATNDEFAEAYGFLIQRNACLSALQSSNPDPLCAAAPQMLAALKAITGIEFWIDDDDVKEKFTAIVYPAIEAAELELRREELEKKVEPMSDEAYEAAISGVSDDHPGMD